MRSRQTARSRQACGGATGNSVKELFSAQPIPKDEATDHVVFSSWPDSRRATRNAGIGLALTHLVPFGCRNMKALLRLGVGLCAIGLATAMVSSLLAQIPGAPAAPAVPGAPPAPGIPAAPAAVPAAPAQPTSIWSFLGITPENCERCRKKICATPLGQMLNNMTLPAQFASGGLIQPCCPPPSADDLKKMLDPNNLNVSPEEAMAAKIKADEAGAKARIAALRYLATVDCHYYPEVADAIIDALRKDRNECVRYEAALALVHGCCCNKKTIAALIIVVSGQDTDGNPSETSQRVKAAALNAMNLCMSHVQYFPDEPVRPETPPEPGPVPPELPPSAAAAFPRVQLTAFYTQYLPTVPRDKLIQQAGRILAEAAGSKAPPLMASQGGLLQMWQDSQDVIPLREEISFDEAALATPARPVTGVKTPAPAPLTASLKAPPVPVPSASASIKVPPALSPPAIAGPLLLSYSALTGSEPLPSIQTASVSKAESPLRASLGFKDIEFNQPSFTVPESRWVDVPMPPPVKDVGLLPAPVPWPLINNGPAAKSPAAKPAVETKVAANSVDARSSADSSAAPNSYAAKSSVQVNATKVEPVAWPLSASSKLVYATPRATNLPPAFPAQPEAPADPVVKPSPSLARVQWLPSVKSNPATALIPSPPSVSPGASLPANVAAAPLKTAVPFPPCCGPEQRPTGVTGPAPSNCCDPAPPCCDSLPPCGALQLPPVVGDSTPAPPVSTLTLPAMVFPTGEACP